MKLYAVNKNNEEEKCLECNWESSVVYLLADSQEEADKIYTEYGGGFCGECIAEMLTQEGYEITKK
jgi:ribosomal protein L34E